MKEVFLKHQTLILRTLGTLMLVISFVVYFWTTPQKALSANEKAFANVARMEAKVLGDNSSSISKAKKSNESPFMKKYKETQATQFRYLLIILMILGLVFFIYSFFRKKRF